MCKYPIILISINCSDSFIYHHHKLPQMAISPPDYLISISWGLTWFEVLFVHPVVLFVSGINLAILSSARILHPNLKFILQVQTSSIIGFEFYRLVLIAYEFVCTDIYASGPYVLQRMGLFFVFFRNALGHVLLIERLLATFFYRQYEKYKKKYFSIGWFCILLFVGLVNSFTTSDTLGYTLTSLIISLALLLLSLIEYLAILIMGFSNKRKYNEFLVPTGGQKEYSLSEKYQLAENIRTSRQLGPAFLCHFLNNILLNCGGGSIYFGLIQDYQIIIMIQISTFISSVIDLAIEFTVITHHPMLKKQFRRILCRIFLCKSENQIVGESRTPEDANPNQRRESSPPKNIHGQILIQRDHPDGHFRRLTHAWR